MEKYFMIRISYPDDDIIPDFEVEDLDDILYEEISARFTKLPNYAVGDITETMQELFKKGNIRSIRKKLGLDIED